MIFFNLRIVAIDLKVHITWQNQQTSGVACENILKKDFKEFSLETFAHLNFFLRFHIA